MQSLDKRPANYRTRIGSCCWGQSLHPNDNNLSSQLTNLCQCNVGKMHLANDSYCQQAMHMYDHWSLINNKNTLVSNGNDLVIIAILNFAHFLRSPPPSLNCASGAESSLAQCLYHLVKELSSRDGHSKSCVIINKKHNTNNCHHILLYYII